MLSRRITASAIRPPVLRNLKHTQSHHSVICRSIQLTPSPASFSPRTMSGLIDKLKSAVGGVGNSAGQSHTRDTSTTTRQRATSNASASASPPPFRTLNVQQSPHLHSNPTPRTGFRRYGWRADVALLLGLCCAALLFQSALHWSHQSSSSTSSEKSHGTGAKSANPLADDDLYRSKLTPEQFSIARKAGTERAFTGKFNDFKGVGIFSCICCGSDLFDSATKYDSGSGWPSFYSKIGDSVLERSDGSGFMQRTEVLCKKCEGHLGHVFTDGPKPTGLRYCINSASIDFKPAATGAKHSDIVSDHNNSCAVKK